MRIGCDEAENSSFSHLFLAIVGPNVCGGRIRPCQAEMSGCSYPTEALASVANGCRRVCLGTCFHGHWGVREDACEEAMAQT
jgi:hypothetical protein